MLDEVVAEHGAARARQRALGALRRVGDVDGDAPPGGHAGPRHLERVELARRLEDGARVGRVQDERLDAGGGRQVPEREATRSCAPTSGSNSEFGNFLVEVQGRGC